MTVIDSIKTYISKYVTVDADELTALALWVLHTWAFSGNYTAPYSTPYLYIFSAERRSGKTRLLEVLETIIRNPMRAADVTSAALFRSIESLNPTLLIDEVDAIWSGAKNEQLRGVLNAGYKRGGNVPRVEGTEVRMFNVFSPKALAGIDNAMLPDTVSDRCIPIHMHRQPVGASAMFLAMDAEPEAERLLQEITAWMDANYEKGVAAFRPAPIDGIGDRAWEISMPLVAIAAAFGKPFEKQARAAIKRLLTREEKMTPESQLLSDIRDAFDTAGTKVLPGAAIVDALNSDGGSWTGKLLASRLRPFGVQPTTIRFKNQVARGYRRMDFEAVWETHLS